MRRPPHGAALTRTALEAASSDGGARAATATGRIRCDQGSRDRAVPRRTRRGTDDPRLRVSATITGTTTTATTTLGLRRVRAWLLLLLALGLEPGYYGYGYGRGYGYGGMAGPATAPYGYDIGSVKLKVKPRDAEVFVDNYFAGYVDDFDGILRR